VSVYSTVLAQISPRLRRILSGVKFHSNHLFAMLGFFSLHLFFFPIKFPSLAFFYTSNLNRNPPFFPSGLAFQLSIRVRSHPTRNPLHVGTFGFAAELFLTILFVTHVTILTSDRFCVDFFYLVFSLRNLTDFLFFALQNVLLPRLFLDNHRFGSILQSRVSLAQTPSSCTLLHVF